jgi:NitT/TauT family transport system permease protein
MNIIKTLRSAIHNTYAVLLAVIAWECMARSGLVSPLLVPTLETIGMALYKGLLNGDILLHTQWTMGRTAIGFGCAVIAGVALGSAMALSGRFEGMLEPVFSFGYPIPKIALYPIFAFLFGLSSGPKIALVFLEALYPIAVGVYQGMKAVDRHDIWAAQTMGANPMQIYWRVIVPRTAPYFMSATRISLHVALATTIVLEMIGDSTGLGYYITYQAASFNFGASFAGIVVVVIVGFGLDRALIWARRKFVFWEQQPSGGAP